MKPGQNERSDREYQIAFADLDIARRGDRIDELVAQTHPEIISQNMLSAGLLLSLANEYRYLGRPELEVEELIASYEIESKFGKGKMLTRIAEGYFDAGDYEDASLWFSADCEQLNPVRGSIQTDVEMVNDYRSGRLSLETLNEVIKGITKDAKTVMDEYTKGERTAEASISVVQRALVSIRSGIIIGEDFYEDFEKRTLAQYLWLEFFYYRLLLEAGKISVEEYAFNLNRIERVVSKNWRVDSKYFEGNSNDEVSANMIYALDLMPMMAVEWSQVHTLIKDLDVGFIGRLAGHLDVSLVPKGFTRDNIRMLRELKDKMEFESMEDENEERRYKVWSSAQRIGEVLKTAEEYGW